MNLLRINPFLRILGPFILGIITTYFLSLSFLGLVSTCLFALLALMVGAWWSNNSPKLVSRVFFGFSLFVLFWCLGAINYGWIKLQNREILKFTESTVLNQNQFVLKVMETPARKKNYFQAGVELYVSQTLVSKGIAYFKDSTRLAQEGDWIATRQKPILFETPKNPGQFNYKMVMESQGYFFSVFVDEFQLLARGNSSGVLSYFEKIQRKWVKIFEHYLRGEELAIASALVLGDKSHLNAEIREAYANVGAMHVLAVSGLHVGLVYLFLNFMLQFLNNSRKKKVIKTLLIVMAILLYAGITGFSASVTRAAIMFSLFALGKVLRRGSSIYNIIFACAFFMLLYNPQLLFNVSFQLSFIAVIGIVYLFPKLFELWIPKSVIVQYLWGLVCLSVSAQLATFPLAMYYFGIFPTWFLLTNLVVVPAAFVELAGGFLLILSHYISDWGFYVGRAYETLIYLVNEIIFWINSIPPGALDTNLDFTATLILYSTLVFWLALLEYPKSQLLRLAQISSILFLCYELTMHILQIQSSGLLIYSAKSPVMELYSGQNSMVWMDTSKVEYSTIEKYVLEPSWNSRRISQVSMNFMEVDKIKKAFVEVDNGFTLVFNCEYLEKNQPQQILVSNYINPSCFNEIDSSKIWFTKNKGCYLENFAFKN